MGNPQQSNIALFIKPKLKARLGLIQQSRNLDAQSVQTFIQLLTLEDKLEKLYIEVKFLKTGTKAETVLLSEIKQLEDQRFSLLDQINGQHIQGYAL